jgi:hypothetical protein
MLFRIMNKNDNMANKNKVLVEIRREINRCNYNLYTCLLPANCFV